MEAVLASVISAIVTLVGTVITVIAANGKTMAEFKTAQAVTETQITELTREVRENNNFARRMPVVEEQIKVINHRIHDLERKDNQ